MKVIKLSGPMVRAILECRKTQTRSVIDPQPKELPNGNVSYRCRNGCGFENFSKLTLLQFCPHGKPGDRIWCSAPSGSRILIEIIDIRVERVQEITAEDAQAEGISVPRCGCEVCAHSSQLCPADASSHIEEYGHRWDHLNAKRGHSWESNPWVWVISFRRLK